MIDLNLLAEFIDRLQDEKRDMMQLTALSYRLFYKGLRDIYSDDELQDYSSKEFMGTFNKNIADEWIEFLGVFADRGEEGQVCVKSTISLSWQKTGRSEFRMFVTPQTDDNDPLRGHGILEKDGLGKKGRQAISIPYGGLRVFEILDRQPVESLLRCPNCLKIFVNTTKRHMKYCSKNCRSHYSMKKIRGQLETGS